MVIQEPERQKFISSTRWSQARWVTFGSSRLGDGSLQEDFGTVFSLVFRSIVKLDSVVCSSSQHTLVLSFMFWFSVFGLTDLGFHE